MKNNAILDKNNMILKKLVWLLNFSWRLILNENKGRLLTSNKEIIIITILKKFKSVNIGKTSKLIWGIAIKKIADAFEKRAENLFSKTQN